jgi:hypothetical protein
MEINQSPGLAGEEITYFEAIDRLFIEALADMEDWYREQMIVATGRTLQGLVAREVHDRHVEAAVRGE